MFMASYDNYSSGHALKDLHQIGMFSLSLSLSLLKINIIMGLELHFCFGKESTNWHQKEYSWGTQELY